MTTFCFCQLQYPVSENGFEFQKSLVEALYGLNIWDRLRALVDVLKILSDHSSSNSKRNDQVFDSFKISILMYFLILFSTVWIVPSPLLIPPIQAPYVCTSSDQELHVKFGALLKMLKLEMLILSVFKIFFLANASAFCFNTSK